MFSEMLNNDVERKLKVIPIDDSIYKLVFAVEKATREFMSKTGKTPTKLIVNDTDFDINGEVQVCGYKVFPSKLVPKGQVIVMDEPVLTKFYLY